MRSMLLLFFIAALSGCGSDRESCLAEAATKPTDTGVRLAAAQCDRQYPKPGPWSQYDKPAPNAFDDLVPQGGGRGFQRSLLPITSVVIVLALMLSSSVGGPASPRIWVLRIARWVCALGVVTQGIFIFVALKSSSANWPPSAWLELGSVVVLLLLFVSAGALIERLYLKLFGTRHPGIAANLWWL